MIEPDQYFAII